MTLCNLCRRIPPAFFRDVDRQPSFFRTGLYVPHHTVSGLRQSAASGCRLCDMLNRSLDADHFSAGLQDSVPGHLRHSLIDPNTEFQYCVGADDLNLAHFYQKPGFWRRLSTRIGSTGRVSVC